MTQRFLTLNGNKFFYDEIAAYSFRNSVPLNGYEAKTLEFCRDWLNGVQEFPIHTSGSTGTPKQITLARKQMELSARRTIKLLGLKADEHMLVCLNTEYIAGMMMIVRGLLADMQMTIVEPVGNPLTLTPADVIYHFSSFVPMQLQTILHEHGDALERLDNMKAILVGGAPVSFSLQRELQQLRVPLYHTYGMTETASHIALRLLNGPNAADYYETIEGVTIGQDNRGCLTITGDLTANEMLVTNDIVEILTPTRFRWIGRADNTINTGGVKVQTEVVEVAVSEALAELEQAPRFFVASQPDELLGEKVILVLEGKPLPEEAEQQVMDKMRNLLHKFEMPKEVYYSPTFSETATGKVSRLRTMQKLGLETD
ncbi:AMP-binding protein [Pontibacter sp. HSC-36F09]|uniref:AMP-binding protein n=1 Tax=Pontibacter sp. HSC-36F09 TaxID=2910966 RepID=UPI00209F842D|nr:AMP-binding protein [Pontibacter sp. HSC-36F09]MCP2044179.1 O-succinylbenzoic acid--CoA ligase [Pontibacter sp. HSC-36F09]